MATLRDANRKDPDHFRDTVTRWKWFRSRRFTGSGAVEAGFRAIIGQCLKLSGTRWNLAGAHATIALHCREASSRHRNRLAGPHPKMILSSYKIDVHPDGQATAAVRPG